MSYIHAWVLIEGQTPFFKSDTINTVLRKAHCGWRSVDVIILAKNSPRTNHPTPCFIGWTYITCYCSPRNHVYST